MLSFFTKDFQNKLYMIIFIFVFHNFILSYIVGFDTSFFIMAILGIIINLYIKRDHLKRVIIDKYFLTYSIYYISYLLILIRYIPTDINDVINVLVLNGIREELFFRFFMIGILINPKKDLTADRIFKIFTVLIIINILFMINHLYYGITLQLFVFTIGGFFSIIFIFCGLIPSIIAHTIHNLYFNNQQSTLIHLGLILPITLSPHFRKFINEIT